MDRSGFAELGQLALGLAIFVLLGYLLAEDMRRAQALYHFIMSRLSIMRPANSVEELVHVPVAATGTGGPAEAEGDRLLPDTGAAEPGT
jgi:hypothetical protein